MDYVLYVSIVSPGVVPMMEKILKILKSINFDCNHSMGQSRTVLSGPCEVKAQDQIGILEVDFYGGRKTGEPREKPSKHRREPTNNSTHIRHWAQRGSNLGRIGER